MRKTHCETYRYGGEICIAEGQSIVECRLPGLEVASVLGVQAHAVCLECTAGNGEVKYSGKLFLNVLYADVDGKICRAERGAEFFHKAANEAVVPACSAVGEIVAENVSVRREGTGIFISTVATAKIRVYGLKEAEYLLGGEGVVAKRDAVPFVRTYAVYSETEEEDEFETEFAQDVLLHGERAFVTGVRCEHGQVNAEGEICLHFCVMKRDGSLCSYERSIPFKISAPCDEAMPALPAEANVFVKSAHLTADTDEEKGKSKILVAFTLGMQGRVYEKEDVTVCQDAFLLGNECTLSFAESGGRYLTNAKTFTERISGKPVLSPESCEGKTVEAVVLPKAEVTCKKADGALQIEGVVEATVLFKNEDGSYGQTGLSLPFLFETEDFGGDDYEIVCAVSGLGVRKRGGETEAEATLRVRLSAYERVEARYVAAIEEGEAIKQPDCAISVFIPTAGDDLWAVAKKLNRVPEEVQRSNPDAVYPLKGGERTLIWRQKTEIS